MDKILKKKTWISHGLMMFAYTLTTVHKLGLISLCLAQNVKKCQLSLMAKTPQVLMIQLTMSRFDPVMSF